MSGNFRYGFYAGLLVAFILGVYLFQLWQPPRQVELHSEHMIGAVQAKDWKAIEGFLDDGYRDQWNQDRALVVSRLRQVLHFARNLRVVAESPMVIAAGPEGKWTARITIEAEDNEIASLVKARVNQLDTPFELQWQRKSSKPWDWKLVRISNSALEIGSADF